MRMQNGNARRKARPLKSNKVDKDDNVIVIGGYNDSMVITDGGDNSMIVTGDDDDHFRCRIVCDQQNKKHYMVKEMSLLSNYIFVQSIEIYHIYFKNYRLIPNLVRKKITRKEYLKLEIDHARLIAR